jgi:maltose-binding protein MalE
MKKYLLVLVLVAAMLLIAACKDKPKWDGLDTEVAGEISIMLWSGDGTFIEDVGKLNLQPEDLAGQNNATIYAVAKAFNQIYPNVKVNVYAKSGGPDDGGVSWAQERENFKNTYGHYPSIWASTDLPGDTTRGLVADLSKYSDDPLYKSFNPAIMSMMNYYGVQAGLPQYLLPWGVYINKELAENNNIDVPQPNWTIADYTDFVDQADGVNFWGAMDTPFSFIFTGTTTMAAQLHNYSGTGNRINANSAEVRALIPYINQWANSAIWPQRDLGNVPNQVMNDNWWWGFKFFMENKILTLDGDPWMMGDGAHPDQNHWGVIKSNDWDIYPRPATPYQGNTVGVVLDPLAVFNYALTDDDPELSEEEALQELIAYTFATFWIGDDRAWTARANQNFLDGENLKSAMNDSFPLVTGDAFDRQMEIWYSIGIHERFANQTLMPGFHEVLRLFESGQIYDVSDKAYLWNYDDNGTMRPILYEWSNAWNPAVVTGNPEATSPRRTDTNWVDSVLAKLPEWNTLFNQRYVIADNALRAGLIEYYGKSESDFN